MAEEGQVASGSAVERVLRKAADLADWEVSEPQEIRIISMGAGGYLVRVSDVEADVQSQILQGEDQAQQSDEVSE